MLSKYDLDGAPTLVEMIAATLGPKYKYIARGDQKANLAATIGWAVETICVHNRMVEVDDMSESGEAADVVLYREIAVQPRKLVDAIRSNMVHMLCALACVPEAVAAQVVKVVNEGQAGRVVSAPAVAA
jgi:predicted nicotinamide N-methyase